MALTSAATAAPTSTPSSTFPCPGAGNDKSCLFLFTDAGNIWGPKDKISADSIRASAGVGPPGSRPWARCASAMARRSASSRAIESNVSNSKSGLHSDDQQVWQVGCPRCSLDHAGAAQFPEQEDRLRQRERVLREPTRQGRTDQAEPSSASAKDLVAWTTSSRDGREAREGRPHLVRVPSVAAASAIGRAAAATWTASAASSRKTTQRRNEELSAESSGQQGDQADLRQREVRPHPVDAIHFAARVDITKKVLTPSTRRSGAGREAGTRHALRADRRLWAAICLVRPKRALTASHRWMADGASISLPRQPQVPSANL